MVGYALRGAAALHPTVGEAAPPVRGEGGRRINWPALALCVLVPPAVLVALVLFDVVFSTLLQT